MTNNYTHTLIIKNRVICFRYIPERLREEVHDEKRIEELGKVKTTFIFMLMYADIL
jgi:hypothetical protein